VLNKSNSLQSPFWVTSAIGAGLLASILIFPIRGEAQCRPTSDPMIQDCSPTLDSYSPPIRVNSSTSAFGKILSLAISADGQRLYAGAYSGVWRSDDRGDTWHQLTRPQPAPKKNNVAGALEVPNIFDLVVLPRDDDRKRDDDREKGREKDKEGDTVLAAAATAVPGLLDTLVPDHSKNGIYRSEDSGESWHLVHQFLCPGFNNFPGAEPVGQIAFAPDNPNLVYAAGGCKVAISTDAGRTWADHTLTDGATDGTVWHVAVAPQEGRARGFIRRIYAAGPDQIWFSSNAGNTWLRDKATPPSETCCNFDVLGNFPSEGFQSSSAHILVVEPGHPERVFLTIPGIMNGPAYFFGPVEGIPVPDGTPSDRRVPPFKGPSAGGGTLWLGDYSSFSASKPAADWQKLPGPPAYQGFSTPSGRVYVAVQPLRRTLGTKSYLLFFGDTSHVHVSLGVPAPNNAFDLTSDWHRIDGRNASQSKLDNDLENKLFVHVDPHAIVASKDFSIALKPPEGIPACDNIGVNPCYDLNSVVDPNFPSAGSIWMANDGGVYRCADFHAPSSTDDGQTCVLGDYLSTLAVQSPFAGVALPGRPPALYLGVPDNDNFFTLDGGDHWGDPVTGCGDCGPWFADPAQPNRVVEFNRPQDRPPQPRLLSVSLYINKNGGYPNAGDLSQRHFIPLPPTFNGNPLKGYKPLVLTTQDEQAPADTDFVLIQPSPSPGRLLRTIRLSEISSEEDWNSTDKVFQQGIDFIAGMEQVNVVQASGGHRTPVFYVGDPDFSQRLWRSERSGWRQIVPAQDGSAQVARLFFANPFHPNEIYIIDEGAIKHSRDGGSHWEIDGNLDRAVTEDGRYRYDVTRVSGNSNSGINAVIMGMIFVRGESTRFVIGNAGVFVSTDGRHWDRLLSTRALPGRPAAAYFDPISDPSDRALYVGLNGRGILRISPIPSP
jgi:photosystem II stability/assembly factor-like uncharacterized protein